VHHTLQILGGGADADGSYFLGDQDQAAGVAADGFDERFEIVLGHTLFGRVLEDIAEQANGRIGVEAADWESILIEWGWKGFPCREDQVRLAGFVEAGAEGEDGFYWPGLKSRLQAKACSTGLGDGVRRVVGAAHQRPALNVAEPHFVTAAL
jgi:hypothetical protein